MAEPDQADWIRTLTFISAKEVFDQANVFFFQEAEGRRKPAESSQDAGNKSQYHSR
jgi:hypothetical protein